MLLEFGHEISLGLAVAFTIVSQMLLRLGSKKKQKAVDVFFNWHTFFGYLIFLVVIVLVVFAMQKLPLKTVTAWNSVTFFLVPLSGFVFLGDPFSRKMQFGSVLILIGVLVFNL
ncbi:MAG: hypothetical protein C0617_07975 [Desulfuromonas sp.]|uniref:hypothetical protein n=1 Tax=Desulfuromonas sp. TaxID=892 RepID=UPI000CBD0B41|nr:hypothetical protein [Desulfuromonas sp.]PLX84415.1 MAG: hypothetical protein C0617_07975 [Desulfuromonas sp.]